jgi:hypothetical protein
MVKKKCIICNKRYLAPNYRSKSSKYCSRICQCNGIREKVKSLKTRLKIGLGNLGKKKPFLIKRNKSEWMKNFNKGSNSTTWKGNKATYQVKHQWIKRNYGQPHFCEHCFRKELNNYKIHWANKSGKYKRGRSDWLRLCIKCHRIYDKGR